MWGNFEGRRADGAPIVIDTYNVMVHARNVIAATAEEAALALRVSGAEPLWPADARKDGDAWQVTLTLGPGRPGEKISVAVANEAATLVRKAGPTARVLLLADDGSWATLTPGVSLAPGPKRLRIQTEGCTAERARVVYVGPNWEAPAPTRETEIAPDLLEVEFTVPVPMLQVLVGGCADPNGLRLPQVSAHFYIGEPPVLYAVDAGTGRADRIGPVPPEIILASVRKDGRYAALTTLAPEGVDGYQTWLVDLSTGQVTRTPFSVAYGFPSDGFDARGRLVSPMEFGRIGLMDPATGQAEVQKSAATFWSGLSPDGRTLAGRGGPPPGRGTGAWIGPPKAYHLVVRDLTTDTEQVFPWDGYASGLYWLPDGRLLQMTVDSNREPGIAPGPETTHRCHLVDPKSGARTDYPEKCLWPAPAAATDSYVPIPDEKLLAWLPDGRALVIRWPNLPNQRRALGP